jgi:hypothetical protein
VCACIHKGGIVAVFDEDHLPVAHTMTHEDADAYARVADSAVRTRSRDTDADARADSERECLRGADSEGALTATGAQYPPAPKRIGAACSDYYELRT